MSEATIYHGMVGAMLGAAGLWFLQLFRQWLKEREDRWTDVNERMGKLDSQVFELGLKANGASSTYRRMSERLDVLSELTAKTEERVIALEKMDARERSEGQGIPVPI